MQAWPLHKIECPMLKRIFPRIVPDAARMLCRLIIRLDNGGDLVRGYCTPTCYRKFRDLMSRKLMVDTDHTKNLFNLIIDYQEIKHDPKRVEHLESLYVILSEMMQNDTVLPNQAELLSIHGRVGNCIKNNGS